MKKHDLWIIAAVILTAAAFLILFPAKKGGTVTVKQNNTVIYEGPLSADKTVELEGNTVVIENSEVYMKNASCKNRVCVHTGKISKKGESIICLPNKVTAQIE